MSDGVTFLWAENYTPDFIQLESKRGDYETYCRNETCELELNIDITAVRCSKCGWEVPKGADLNEIKFCCHCGRRVTA
jgi:hypothetical protein